MAQTFGMGRYVPPELEGTVSHNQASGKGHALGARARKLKTEGILVVRFECPFAIWCTNCQPEQIIGQGVRFNAEKKKVGNYYSTPIWSFRFKHTICGKELEVRTDPKNAEYVVVDGGRRRDYGGGAGDSLFEDSFRIGTGMSEEDKDRLEKEGGFAALERKVADKREHDSQTKRLNELSQTSDKNWADPYEMSRKLRRDFRVGRRQRQADEKSGDALKDKFGIGIDLLAPITEDDQRTKLVDFGEVKERNALSQSMFDARTPIVSNTESELKSHKKASKSERLAKLQKTNLQTSLQGNTRSIVDPFLQKVKGWTPATKRKRTDEGDLIDDSNAQPGTAPSLKATAAALVSYDSDST